MSKKLSLNEINVLSNVIRERINESKYEKIKSKLEKDVDYKKLEKISKEISVLDKKNKELINLYSEVNLKLRNKFEISNVWKDSSGGIKVMFNNDDYNKIYNEVLLMNINKEFNVNEMIDKIVEKFS
jgi:hypothetical protein